MRATVLLTLFNGLTECDKMRGLQSILLLFQIQFYRSMNDRLCLSREHKTSLKYGFCRETVNSHI